MRTLRFFIVRALWRIPGVSRRYCWASAVAWAAGHDCLWTRADHACFYCAACNTEEEIIAYQTQGRD
jgi:hypothetical protein